MTGGSSASPCQARPPGCCTASSPLPYRATSAVTTRPPGSPRPNRRTVCCITSCPRSTTTAHPRTGTAHRAAGEAIGRTGPEQGQYVRLSRHIPVVPGQPPGGMAGRCGGRCVLTAEAVAHGVPANWMNSARPPDVSMTDFGIREDGLRYPSRWAKSECGKPSPSTPRGQPPGDSSVRPARIGLPKAVPRRHALHQVRRSGS